MKSAPLFIYGKHAALAALSNPMRKIKRVMVTKNTHAECANELSKCKNLAITDAAKIDSQLPRDAVHQGIVVECEPLEQVSLQGWLKEEHNRPVLLLDQVSDPHNVGAILRTAAAFGVGAVITLERNAAQESGTLAKSASGALEVVPLISVGNLAQTIKILKKAGYWTYGLDGEAKETIGQQKFDAKTALILGAEGRGLRRLTAEHCDFLVKIPMSGQMESLNVSNAAAVAMYEIARRAS
ncbi:MAG: 23S rRNA (guanosine(2251)-2'-O)-methyltransferase RlmB [Rickettsiales bacterium]|jgi:23S rRNA (guanosine2251-2'-O)-methyltransferase|nr:23S rRNA (guanosine(2251)-2'-O)-methyltransferase RlmB [Rickettsiales bacterium]